MMKQFLYTVAALVLMAGLAQAFTVTYSNFLSGSTISSTEMNQNFADVEGSLTTLEAIFDFGTITTEHGDSIVAETASDTAAFTATGTGFTITGTAASDTIDFNIQPHIASATAHHSTWPWSSMTGGNVSAGNFGVTGTATFTPSSGGTISANAIQPASIDFIDLKDATKSGDNGTLVATLYTTPSPVTGNCVELLTDGAGGFDLVDSGAACGSGAGATTSTANVTFPSVATDDFAIGGNDTSAAFYFDESTGIMTINIAGGEIDITPAAATGGTMTLKEGSNNGANEFVLSAPAALTASNGCTVSDSTTGELDDCITLGSDVSNAELAATFSHCETLYAPNDSIAATDDIPSLWRAPAALTITEVYCETDQTITLDLQIDDGTPADVMGADLNCSTGASDSTGLTGSMADGDRLDLLIATASGTPTRLNVCWEYTF